MKKTQVFADSPLISFLIPGNRAKSWASLEELHAQGKLKAIGVSNYTPTHMKELMQSCKVPPALLQVCIYVCRVYIGPKAVKAK